MNIRLKEIMQEKGVTGRHLAALMGTSPQYISNLVSGRQSLSMNTIEDISNHLGVQPWELFVSKSDIIGEECNKATGICPHCGKPITIETIIK